MNGLGLGATKSTAITTPTTMGRTDTKTLLPGDYFNSYNVEGGLLTFTAAQAVGGQGGAPRRRGGGYSCGGGPHSEALAEAAAHVGGQRVHGAATHGSAQADEVASAEACGGG